LNNNERDEILAEIDTVIGEQKELSFGFLLSVFMGVLLVLLLAFPKIFLQSSIYYKSRDISSLEREYRSLKEEHKIISTEVEQKKFKNQILDTLF
jgi:cell division protein FtsL